MYEGMKVAERHIADTDLTEIVKLIVGEGHVHASAERVA